MKNIFYVFKARTLCTLAAILFFAGAANAVLSLTGLRWSINGGEYGTDPINAGDQVTFSVQVTNNQGSPYASCGGTDGIQGTNTTKWGIVWRIDATTGGCYAYHDAAHDTLPNGSSFWADVMGTCNGEHPAYWVATAGAHTIYVRGDGGCTPESSMPSVGFPITVTLNCNPIATTNYNGTVKDSPWATDVNIDWRNFDNGVEGCAYQRVAGQQGTFRSISNFFSSDDNQETKGYNATGWCRNGAWMGYTFEITTAGTYTFSSFGRKRNGQDNDRVNYKVYEVVGGVLGDQVGSTLYSANWGDSGDPHEVTSTSSMHLNAGVYQLRVQIDNNGDGDGDNSLTWSKINTVSIDAPCTLTPFAGNAPTNDPAGPYGVGTYVWAPYYDNGGQNCSFYNANTNAGEDHPRGIANEPETHDNNLKNAIGWTTEGDWMIYSITVAIAGQYDIMTEMAGWATSSNVKFDFYQSDGVTSAGIGQITLGGSTGGSGTYNAFTTASPITFAAGTYKVKVTIGNSVNFRGFQLQIPCTAPTITNVAGNSSCGAGSLTLSATASSGTAVINWYAAATGGSPLATGGTYSPSPSATTTYWVDATDDCTTATRTSVTATINPIPAVNNPGTVNVCVGGTAAVTFSGTDASTYTWAKTSGSIGSEGGTGNISFAADTEGTATFTVTPFNATCTGTAQTFTITVNALPTTPTNPTSAIICAGSNLKDLVPANTSGDNWFWQESASGTDATHNADADYTAVSGTYYLRARNTSNCWSSNASTAVTVNTVTTPPVITDEQTCRGDLNTLTINDPAGCYWQTTEDGTSIDFPAFEGVYYVQDNGTSGTPYYLRKKAGDCWSTADMVTVINSAAGNEAPTYNVVAFRTSSQKNAANTGTYLYDTGTGTLAVGTTTISDAAKWFEIPTDNADYKYYKNVSTGNYLYNPATGVNATDNAQSCPINKPNWYTYTNVLTQTPPTGTNNSYYQWMYNSKDEGGMMYRLQNIALGKDLIAYKVGDTGAGCFPGLSSQANYSNENHIYKEDNGTAKDGVDEPQIDCPPLPLQLRTAMTTESRQLTGTQYYLGDPIQPDNFPNGHWGYNFDLNQFVWTEEYMQAGICTPDSVWEWATASFVANVTGGKRVQLNIGSLKFTQEGRWYFMGRGRLAAGNDYVYACNYNSNGSWGSSTALDTAQCYYLDIKPLQAPTAASVTTVNGITPKLKLNVSAWNNKYVMVVRYPHGATAVSPTQGLSADYEVGTSLGEGKVLVTGTSATVSNYIDDDITENTEYDYYFYSANYFYYSEPLVITAKAEEISITVKNETSAWLDNNIHAHLWDEHGIFTEENKLEWSANNPSIGCNDDGAVVFKVYSDKTTPIGVTFINGTTLENNYNLTVALTGIVRDTIVKILDEQVECSCEDDEKYLVSAVTSTSVYNSYSTVNIYFKRSSNWSTVNMVYLHHWDECHNPYSSRVAMTQCTGSESDWFYITLSGAPHNVIFSAIEADDDDWSNDDYTVNAENLSGTVYYAMDDATGVRKPVATTTERPSCSIPTDIATPQAISETITVYPNPATDMLYISGISENAQVTLYDITGKTLLSSQGSKLNVSMLPAGIYILKAESRIVKVVKK